MLHDCTQPACLSACQVACLSRTGVEPGGKKVNQDNVVAFEEFINPAGALFGAMDGHGPHGAQQQQLQQEEAASGS